MKRSPIKRGKPLTRKAWPSRGGTLTPRRAPLPQRNAKRAAKRRAEHHGTEARSQWFRSLHCACTEAGRKPHPACSGHPSDPSHTSHFNGDASTIIPQSRGCHDYIGAQEWERWETETGVDRHALAAHLATRGPDAPLGDQT